MLQLEGGRGASSDGTRAGPASRTSGVPSGSGPGLPYHAALDGLRGLAVAAVVGYHLGVPWLRGGFLGVSLFFTLSGFLITNLLLTERASRGSVALGSFWARRARRLLPAALCGMALAVAVTGVVGTPDQLRRLPGDVAGAALYGANWRFVLGHSRYSAGYQAPSALLHYWSLAIEEQIYVALPLLVLASTRRRRSRGRLLTVLLTLMGVSVAVMLAVGGRVDVSRAYFGTDTRMFELLAGALLAVAIGLPAPAGQDPAGGRLSASRALTFAGLSALALTAAMWALASEGDRWLYRGGLWLVAGGSVALIAAAVHPGVMARLLSRRPLVRLGKVSYGVYVYHWPLFLLLDPAHTGLRGVPLAGVRLLCTAGVAAASYRWLEQPVRQGRWRPRRVTWLPAVPAALVLGALVVSGEASARAVASPASSPVVLAARTAPAPPASRAASPGPLPVLRRVLLMGDSLVHQALPTFAARLAARGVDVRAVGGPGQSLMTNHAAELPALRTMVASWDPDVVVLESCCGQLATDPAWVGADGRSVPRASPPLWAEWRRLATEASLLAASRGAVVLWVLGPPLHTNGWYGPVDAQVSTVNAMYQSVVACVPGAGAVDWRVVSGPAGQYAEALPDAAGHLVRIRTADGFHFTPAGWDLLARITVDQIDRQWAIDGGRSGRSPMACP